MNVVYILGSQRSQSNVNLLLNLARERLDGRLFRLADLEIEFCSECWACLKENKCVIKDDMTKKMIPILLEADVIVLGSPVFFNNVSARLKNFMDRTWSIRGKLRNKIGAAVVVGRAYGHQAAIDAIHSFFLKHEMIPANRGVSGFGHKYGEILDDTRAVEAINGLTDRILSLKRELTEN